MRLIYNRSACDEHCHRDGGPYVYRMLQAVCNGRGIWLDDFADASFAWRSGARPIQEPWVAIFHHPVEVNSPLKEEAEFTWDNTLNRRNIWARSRDFLKGAVCLSQQLADHVRAKLGIPVIALPHPTPCDRPTWKSGVFKARSDGYFIRDTRILHKMQKSPSYDYERTAQFLPWHRSRDARLKTPLETGVRVTDVQYMQPATYDTWMARGVHITYLYGACANNVVIECMARCTPLLVNPLPTVVEYLGRQYPLYFETPQEAFDLLHDVDRVMCAHEYLKGVDPDFLDGRVFAQRVKEFAESC